MEREDLFLREVSRINAHLGGIALSLEQIDSKMPFEEQELAANKAETDTLLREMKTTLQRQDATNLMKVELLKEALDDVDL